MKLVLLTVLALAGLALLQFAVAALRQDRARNAFHRCLESARTAGVEDAFMARFNSAARYGDSLDKIIQGWRATRIRRMCEEAMPK